MTTPYYELYNAKDDKYVQVMLSEKWKKISSILYTKGLSKCSEKIEDVSWRQKECWNPLLKR